MYTLPKTGRTIERTSRAPVYRLAAQAPTVTPATPRPLPIDRLGVRRGSYGHDLLIRERLQQPRQPRTPRASHAFSVNAPALNLPTLARLSLLVADESKMPGIFGSISLRIDRDAVDLNRVKSGILNLCIDHDASRPAGRIVRAGIDGAILYATAEIAKTPDGADYLRDIDAGLRIGVSPGFIISGFELQEDGDNLHAIVASWQPYEISATAIPRNGSARIIGRASMNGLQTPELVSTSDVVGVELACIRLALQTGQGTGRRRAAMERYIAGYDRLTGQGVDHLQAARQASEQAKRNA